MGVVLDQQFAGPGARVSEITSGSGADQAGLEAGDVIVKVDDRSIDDATELVVAVRDYAPGDRIVVVFQRGSQDRSVELVLGDGGE
jgi:putative serine protease PepD